MFIAKTFYMSRTSKNEPTIRDQNFRAKYEVKKSGSIATTSRQSGIKNLKPNFVDLFKYYI